MASGKPKLKGDLDKEIRAVLKHINPDIKRLLDLTEDPGDMETVLVEAIRSGARNLRIAWQIAKKE